MRRSFHHVIIIPLLFIIMLPVALLAQSGEVSGEVRDEEGAPLPGAVVRVEGTKLGAVADVKGSFVVKNVPAGERSILVTAIGYEQVRQRVDVRAGGSARVSVKLKSGSVESEEVVVQGTRSRREQSDTRTSVTKIEPRDAKYLPGAAEDVMRSLRSLPGVLAPNDFSAQLVVRGSGPDQNLILLDDIEVFNPYRLYGFISMFNPESLSDITLLTGGFPAKYGDRLSAVLDVTNREGERTESVTGKFNASLTNANLMLEGKLPGGLEGGWLLSARRTYYDLIAAPLLKSAKVLEGDVALPNFRDLQFKAIARPSAAHSFVANALLNRDGTEITSSADRDRIDSFSVVDESYNAMAGLSWRYTPNEKFISNTVASWYRNNGETEFGGEGGGRLLYGDLSRDSVIKLMQALPPAFQDSLRKRGIDPNNPPALGLDNGQAGFSFRKYSIGNESSYQTGAHKIDFGAGVDLMETSILFEAETDSLFKALRTGQGRSSFPDSVNSVAEYYRAHAYLQDRIAIGERLYLQPGLRYDYYAHLEKSYLSPRVSASYSIDPLTTLRAAFGVYYQSPGYEKLLDRQAFFNLSSDEVKGLRAERSIHYVLGAERYLTDEWQLKVEGYYKSFDDLIIQQRVPGTRYTSEAKPGGNLKYPSGWTTPVAVVSDSSTSIPINGGHGQAYGMEVLLQKIGTRDGSRLTGWVSYALAWATRYREEIAYPFSFDQRHTVNVVLNYRANDWLEIGGNFQLGSGYPFTPAKGFSPIVIVRYDSAGRAMPSIATNIFGEVLYTIDRGDAENVNTARLPIYHRLDLRATFYTKWWGLDWALYLDVINVYNHTNVLSRRYTVDRNDPKLTTSDVSMFPILPTIGIGIKF